MKASIVIPSFNRKSLLINTLRTILNSVHKNEIEIILIDDGSNEDNRLEDLVGFEGMDVKLKRIEPEEKTWYNSVIPLNMGFNMASGDAIIMQNAECLHVGDLVAYVVNNLKNGYYLVFSCYSIGQFYFDKIKIMDFGNDFYDQAIKDAIKYFRPDRPERDFSDGWYNHSYWNPSALHFCSALTKTDLEFFGGFDENYARGISYDDFDFLDRIKLSRKAQLQLIDAPFVIHQPHPPCDSFDAKDRGKLFMRNQFYRHNSVFQHGEPVIVNQYFNPINVLPK